MTTDPGEFIDDARTKGRSADLAASDAPGSSGSSEASLAKEPKSRALTKLLWAFNLFLAYALSPLPLGIALDLMPPRMAAATHAILRPAYTPLIWLSEHSRRVHDFYDWYEHLLDV